MGFWDTLGSVAKEVGSNLKEQSDRIRETKARYEGKSDDELRDIANDSSFFSSKMDRAIARKVLRERDDD